MVVQDLRHTVEYYRDALGFELASAPPASGPASWALLRRGDAVLLLHGAAGFPGGFRPEAGSLLTVRFLVRDAAALYDAVRGRAEVVQPPVQLGRGTFEFAIRDCNGVILTFVQADQK